MEDIMEWIISIVITFIGIWCLISFAYGLALIWDEDDISNMSFPFRITFISEIFIIAICILIIFICMVKEIIFGG